MDPRFRELRNLIKSGDVPGAGLYFQEKIALMNPEPLSNQQVSEMISAWVAGLLTKSKYIQAASFLWGEEIFTPEPRSVGLIWNEIPITSELIVLGCGSVGKSFSVAVWLLLDWLRDPQHTCIKVLSVTEEHAKRNVFAHIQNLHESACIGLAGERKDKSIQVGEDDKQGIHLMTIPPGDEGKGRLRGFHPVPRGWQHAQFGPLTRIRVVLDEAEEIPEGVWEDVDNILITKQGTELVKVIGMTNPKDRNSKLGQRAEPVDGWASVSIETSERWPSRLGWSVVRIDGAKTENVALRKVVFPGLLTWEGYARYLTDGANTPAYYTMARGWFPEQGLATSVIPLDFIDKARGEYLFSGKVAYCAAIDLAFEGGDKAVMTIGRFGEVSGWTPARKEYVTFGKDRYGLQVLQQFELAKTDTLDMTRQIMETCKNLGIKPEWLIVDRTGNGTGVHDTLRIKFGQQVIGLNFGEGSTDTKVLEDDEEKASDLYEGVVTELFFAARKYMEFDYLKISPGMKVDILTKELTDRRYRQSKKKRVKVESKAEYKSRGNKSPDWADSFTLLVHLVRKRTPEAAVMLVNERSARQQKTPKIGLVDTLVFESFD